MLKPSKFATLLRISTTPPYNPHSALFIRTLLGLKNVIDSIFGNSYNEDWQNILNEFQECILELDTKLGLNYKFKFHFLFEHIPYYVQKYGALGKYNEQTIEGQFKCHTKYFLCSSTT